MRETPFWANLRAAQCKYNEILRQFPPLPANSLQSSLHAVERPVINNNVTPDVPITTTGGFYKNEE